MRSFTIIMVSAAVNSLLFTPCWVSMEVAVMKPSESAVGLNDAPTVCSKWLAEVEAPIPQISLPFQAFCGAQGAEGWAGSKKATI